MSSHTNIPWCDSTVNPTSGCDGCELWNAKKRTCYAGNWHESRAAVNPQFAGLYAPSFSEVRLIPGRVREAMSWSDLRGKDRKDKPWLNGRARHIFIGDLSDIFSAKVDFEFLRSEVVEPLRSDRGQRHVGMMLTKRPLRFVDFAEWLLDEHNERLPGNLIAMTTVTSQATAQTRIPALAKLFDLSPLTRLMISAEPLLERVDFRAIDVPSLGKFDGIIVGGESGDGAEPCDIEWLRHTRDVCEELEIDCFVKQLGSEPVASAPGQDTIRLNKIRDRKGEDMSEWPEGLRVRSIPRTAKV